MNAECHGTIWINSKNKDKATIRILWPSHKLKHIIKKRKYQSIATKILSKLKRNNFPLKKERNAADNNGRKRRDRVTNYHTRADEDGK